MEWSQPTTLQQKRKTIVNQATACPVITREAALAYLGGPLMNALAATGLGVTVRAQMLVIAYDSDNTLATVSVQTDDKGTAIYVHWYAGYKRRPGVYSFDGPRINVAGMMSAMQREIKRYTGHLEAERAAVAEHERFARIEAGNRPISDALTEVFGRIVRAADADTNAGAVFDVAELTGGEFEPSQNIVGNVVFALKSTFLDTTPELATQLFAVLHAIEAAHKPAPADANSDMFKPAESVEPKAVEDALA
jgi:hypothetical protein